MSQTRNSLLLWDSGTCQVHNLAETAQAPSEHKSAQTLVSIPHWGHGKGDHQGLVSDTDFQWTNEKTLKIGFFRQGLTGERLTEERFEFLTKKVKKIAPEWCKYANLNFEFIDDEERITECDIRVQFGKHGHVTFLGTISKVLSSGEPSMILGFDIDIQFSEEEYQQVILHEFGHAIAFIHEHQSPNLPKEIVWDEEAILKYYNGDKELADSQFLKKRDEKSTNASVYDPESIMHYPIYKGWVKSMPDYVHKKNSTLSELDKTHVQKIYPGRKF